jgi:hypothetical protein
VKLGQSPYCVGDPEWEIGFCDCCTEHSVEVPRFSEEGFLGRGQSFCAYASPHRCSVQKYPNQPVAICSFRWIVGEQRLAHGRKQPAAAVRAIRKSCSFETRGSSPLILRRLRIRKNCLTVGIRHAIRQQRHHSDQPMLSAVRAERVEREPKRNAQARQPVICRAGLKHVAASTGPIVEKALQARLAGGVGGQKLDRQRMTVERRDEPGDGRIVCEMIAGVAKEKRFGFVISKAAECREASERLALRVLAAGRGR